MVDVKKYDPDFLEKLRGYRLMDDEFMRACFKDNPEAVQLVLRIILNDNKLRVITLKTQEDMKNLFGKSTWFDIHAIDQYNRHLDIEIQNASKGAGPHRARYYSSMLDANISNPAEEYNNLPDTFVIMIAEKDVLHGQRPLYHIDRMVEETGKPFSDGSHIIYVNGEYRGEDPLGVLMKDFHEMEPDKIHYQELRDRAHYFKKTEEGVSQMSDEFMKYVNEHKDEWIAEGKAKGKAEGKAEERNDMLNIAQALREGKSDSEIIELYNVTMEQIDSTRKIMGM